MTNIDIQIGRTSTIVLNDKLSGLVTITTEDLSKQNLPVNFIYKVSPDGKILNVTVENNIGESLEEATVNNTKEIVIEKLIKFGFEQIPVNLNELELNEILEFSKRKIVKKNDYSKMYPFSVETTNSGDLKVILLMYNGSNNAIPLTKFPFKLKDAKDKVIIVDVIDINKTVSPSKIVICEVKIARARLSEQIPDLTTWTVTFEMQ